MTEAAIRPASFGQRRLWFLEQLDAGSAAYNLPWVIQVRGELDVPALEAAIFTLATRHESLRTTFRVVDGEPFQAVHPPVKSFSIPLMSVADEDAEARREHALQLAVEEGQGRFDLEIGPLWRAKLIQVSAQEHLLVLTLHHSITDGWSMHVLFEELGAAYEAFLSGQQLQLSELPMQYGDFARWQRDSASGSQLEKKLEFWERALRDVPPLFDLPSDRPRPPVQGHEGRQHRAVLSAGLSDRLKQLGMASGATLFMTLLAGFETLLWRYTRAEAFVIGTPVAGRSEVEFERLVGLFTNTLPLRADLAGDPTFRELLERVRCSTFEAIGHQDVPFETIVDRLRPERSLSYTPLFQVMFILQNMPHTAQKFRGAELEELSFDQGISKFDLTLEVFEDGDLHCRWEYRSDLFDQERIERMAEHFEVMLAGIVADPGRRLSEYPLLTSAEEQTLREWNATEADYARDRCIHEVFERQAAERGDAPALILENRKLTFRELNAEANVLARRLQELGVGPHSYVAVFTERSAEAIAAILAVMKAGGIYVPIDAAYPKKRVEFMLADCGAKVLVTQRRLQHRTPAYSGTVLYVDRDRDQALSGDCSNPRVPVAAGDPAYVIYTSGSTGNPKGVVATHRASLNRFAWMWRAYPFEAAEVCAQRTSLSFVDSIWEIFGPLLAGVPISLVPDDVVKDPEQFVRHLEMHEVTRVVMVPSLIESLLEGGTDLARRLRRLRLCISSGEALSSRLLERFRSALPRLRLINLYGSSEVAADVTCFDTSNGQGSEAVPIGRPIDNVRIYILDPDFRPVPIGIPGEIYVGGDCLAQAYLGRDELTAQRFPTLRPERKAAQRLYRTGDLGRFRPDGNVEFLGRADRQIKVRGMRVEPGEIEALLAAHSSVQQVVVVARPNGRSAESSLIAYLTAAEGEAIVAPELRRYLQARLAEPMIPEVFVDLPSLPLTANGKSDYLALPAPDPSRSASRPAYVGPRNPTEEKLAEIWSEVLGLEKPGIYDHFFTLGGHSLMAVRVVARIRRNLRTEVAVRSLFEEPTIAGLAAVVEKAQAGGAIANGPDFSARSGHNDREQLMAKMSELSDEQVQALLQTVLASRLQGAGAR